MGVVLKSLSNGVMLASMTVFSPTNLQKIKDSEKDDPKFVRNIEHFAEKARFQDNGGCVVHQGPPMCAQC